MKREHINQKQSGQWYYAALVICICYSNKLYILTTARVKHRLNWFTQHITSHTLKRVIFNNMNRTFQISKCLHTYNKIWLVYYNYQAPYSACSTSRYVIFKLKSIAVRGSSIISAQKKKLITLFVLDFTVKYSFRDRNKPSDAVVWQDQISVKVWMRWLFFFPVIEL